MRIISKSVRGQLSKLLTIICEKFLYLVSVSWVCGEKLPDFSSCLILRNLCSTWGRIWCKLFEETFLIFCKERVGRMTQAERISMHHQTFVESHAGANKDSGSCRTTHEQDNCIPGLVSESSEAFCWRELPRRWWPGHLLPYQVAEGAS